MIVDHTWIHTHTPSHPHTQTVWLAAPSQILSDIMLIEDLQSSYEGKNLEEPYSKKNLEEPYSKLSKSR